MFLIYKSTMIRGCIKPRKRRGARGLHDRNAWQSIDQPTLEQLAKSFSKRGTVSKISARQHQMIRNTPFKLLCEFERNRLLPFDAKRIDRVNQVNRTVFGKLANHVHANIEIGLDLQHLRAVVQRLRQLRMTHLTTRNDDRARQIGARGLRRETRRRVPRACTRDESRAELKRLRDGDSHPRVFERPGRIATLMLEF